MVLGLSGATQSVTRLKSNVTPTPNPPLKKTVFFHIHDGESELIVEDRTKRGLTVREKTIDEKHKVDADKGMIYDMDGIGHTVSIRWYFPKSEYTLEQVMEHIAPIEKKYIEMRELTCPDDD